MIDYEELRIRAFKTGRRRYFMFANGPAAAAAVINLEKEPLEYRQDFYQVLREEFAGQPGGPQRRQGRAIERLGRQLFDVVLPPAICKCLHKSLEWAKQEKRSLRVRFDSSPELMDIPFEIVCSSPGDPLGTVVLKPAISLVRSLPGLSLDAQRIPQADDERTWFPLLVIAPSQAGRETIGREEIDKIQAVVPGFGPQEDFIHLLGGTDPGTPRPTKDNLSSLLAAQGHRPCAVLVIAHGEYRQGEIVVSLEKDNGRSDPMPAQVLAQQLSQAKGLRLVILNLCLGSEGVAGEPFSGLAQALIAAGIPAVVAMQAEVSDEAATEFSSAILGSLWRNETVDEAVSNARSAITPTLRTSSEWCTPVLFLHRACSQGWLFKVPELRVGKKALRDPLVDEKNLRELIVDHPDLDKVARVAHFLRGRGDWKQVGIYANLLTIRRPRMADRYRRLALEAKAELQIEDLERICETLAREGEVPHVGTRIDELQAALPSHVIKVLAAEVREAGEVFQRYGESGQCEDLADWQGAAENYASILALRPSGYQDAEERLRDASRELTKANLLRDAEAAREEGSWELARLFFHAALAASPKDSRQALAGAAYTEGRIAEEQGDWERAAQVYGSLQAKSAGYDDSRDRESYARGRFAEEREDWQTATEAFASLTGTFADIALRLPYAQARAAEASGRWAEAAELLAALDPGSRDDIRPRGAYARGRHAQERGDWQDVLDALEMLPDDYRGGEVRLRRGLAQAKLAEALESWESVIDALRELPGDFCAGEVSALRSFAEGRHAEGREDWPRAEAAYGLVCPDYKDTAARAAYARGRQAEEEERWAAAAAAFAALPEPFREDVAPRRLYAEGRAAEERDEWEAAAAAYGKLAAGSRDTGERLPYARARQAAQRDDWAEVIAAATPLPAIYRDAGRLLVYAEGRLAETREDWQAAADAYESSRGFADAGERLEYARGRHHELEGDWSQALAAWVSLASQLRDLAERRERLDGLMRAIPWADGLVAAGLAADPCAGSLGLLPYAAFREVGIHPGSPGEAIKNASFALMEKGSMTPEARAAWDHLRSLEGRLRVDALLYALEDREALRRQLRHLPAGSPEEILAGLCAALPGDAPLFHLLAGRRKEALAAWEADPSRGTAVHSLALAHFFHARELEATGAQDDESSWEEAIAGWVRVLSDDAYWESWRCERVKSYRQPVAVADIARLRSELGQQLLDHLTDRADRYAAEGSTTPEERYRELSLLLEMELEGARLLREIGGLPLGENGEPRLVCGPLYLRLGGLGARLGARVAELEKAAGVEGEQEDILTALDAALGVGDQEGEAGDIQPGVLFRLRCTFSELGAAFRRLDGHQPELALQALPPIYQARLAELPADCAGPDFERRNPAYARLPNCAARLLQDAVELAVRAHLGIALTALTAGGGMPTAFQSWQEAIKVSRNAGSQVRTKRAIVRVVLGRAQALAQERGSRRGERLTAAIELVEQARDLIGGADRGQLAALAAKLLTDRGVWFGYGCHEYQNPDYEKAAQDLRRALDLTPDSLHARDNLSRALIFQAANLQLHGEPGRLVPLKLLAEAIAVLHEGLCRTAGHRQLVEILQRGLDELEEHILYELSTEELARRIVKMDGPSPALGERRAEAQRLAAAAARRRDQGDETGELMTLISAVRCDASDDVIRRALLSAVQHRAGLEG